MASPLIFTLEAWYFGKKNICRAVSYKMPYFVVGFHVAFLSGVPNASDGQGSFGVYSDANCVVGRKE